MTEAQISQKLRAAILKQAPGAVVLKHNDRIVRGIPDFSATYGGRTTWIEVKYVRRGETPKHQRKHFEKAQLHQALKLEKQGRCLYLIAYDAPVGLQAVILKPSYLAQALEAEVFRVSNMPTWPRLRGALDVVMGYLIADLPIKEVTPNWDRDTGNGFNERGYPAGQGTYHDPMG